MPVVVVAVAFSVIGCDDRGTEPELPDVTQWVTGEALQALDASGHFVLSPVEIPAERPIIGQQQALDLAVAYLRTSATNSALVDWVTAQRRGQRVDLATIQPSRRVEVAISPYETTPPEFGDATLRFRGSFYIVRFLENGEPAVSVGVAAHATDVTIVDGKVQFPSHHGSEFIIAGDPPGLGFENPISPEGATRIAAEATGARIDRQPLLRGPNWLLSQFYSRWLLHLDRPVRFRRVATGAVIEASIVYVGPALDDSPVGTIALWLPQETQPTTENVSSDKQLRVRNGYPVLFDRVIAVP